MSNPKKHLQQHLCRCRFPARSISCQLPTAPHTHNDSIQLKSAQTQTLTQQLFSCAAGNFFDLHARQREGGGAADHGRRAGHGGGRCREHFIDQRRLEGPLYAPSN